MLKNNITRKYIFCYLFFRRDDINGADFLIDQFTSSTCLWPICLNLFQNSELFDEKNEFYRWRVYEPLKDFKLQKIEQIYLGTHTILNL